jgi:4-amino-4-deoxy-L-arabinose transferase-like glycosyltransferase
LFWTISVKAMRPHSILLPTFLFAAAVRLIYVATLHSDASFFAEADAGLYWSLSEHLRDAVTATDRMPLYPLFLAGCRALFGDSPRAVAIVQALLDAGTCAMIARLAMLVSRPAAIAAGILGACSATLIVYSAQMLTDTLMLFFLTAALLAAALFLQRPTLALAAAAGLAAGLALAVRPVVALLLPALAALILARTMRLDFRRAVIGAALFCVVAALPVAPTVIRNYLYFDRLALTSQSGVHLAIWIAPMLRQRQDGTPYETSVNRINAAFDAAVKRAPDAFRDPFQQSSLYIQLALAELASISPATFIKAWTEGAAANLLAPAALGDPRVRTMEKPSFFATPGQSMLERATHYFKSSSLAFTIVVIAGTAGSILSIMLGAIGFVRLCRDRAGWAALAAVPIVYFLVLTGPVVSAKYRMPMEPSLIVLAGIGLAALLGRRSVETQGGPSR